MTAPEHNNTPIERNDASRKYEDNRSRSSLACFNDAYTNKKVDFSPVPPNNICLRPANQNIDVPPAPYPVANNLATENQRVLADEKSHPEDKLKAIYDMSRTGATQVALGKDNARKYDIQEEAIPNSNRHMVHLFATGDDGKKHVVYRGIVSEDGKVQQERDAHGRHVSYEGNAWSRKTHKGEEPQHLRTHPAEGQEEPKIPLPKPRPEIREKAPEIKEKAPETKEKTPEKVERQPEQHADLLSDAARFMSNLAQSAEQRLMNGIQTVGLCARGVRKTLNAMGFHIEPGRPATELGEYLHRTGNFDKIPISELKGQPPEGAILVRNWNHKVIAAQGRNIGHIAIVGHNGKEFSDHIAHTKPDGGYYQNSYVLVPKGYYNNSNT
jgi:hypothetical protein